LCRSIKYPEDDFISRLHNFSLVRNNYPGYIENPGGYTWKALRNSINKYFRGEKNDFSDIENLSDTVEMDDFDKKSLKEKLDDFIRGIHKLNLPPNQRRLIEEMVVICENDHKTHRDFIKEVREAQANHGVTNANFRKLLERLKNNLRGNDGLKDMLSFIPTDDENINELIEFLLSFIPMVTNKLDAYRFSSEEMKKMLWLKDLFEKNKFTVASIKGLKRSYQNNPFVSLNISTGLLIPLEKKFIVIIRTVKLLRTKLFPTQMTINSFKKKSC
jgi:hypothetical protein